MKYILSAGFAAFAMASVASAAPMSIAGVDFDSDNGAVEVRIAQGGHFVGPPSGQRTVGDLVPEATGYDLNSSWEIDSNGTAPDDILSFLFANPLVNGAGACNASADENVGVTNAADIAGCDLVVFELLNQPDNPTLSLTLGGTTILGVLLAEVDVDTNGDGMITSADDNPLAIWGFDLAGLGLMVGQAANNPIFVGRDVGTPDVAAIVGLNFGMGPPDPVVPLPAAAPLFFAGLAGLGFAGRRRKKRA